MIRRRKTPADAASPAPDLGELVEQHLDDVVRYLLYLTGQRAVAEDLAADTFERALRQRDRFDAARGNPRAWLLAIARGVALDHFRSEQRRVRREQSFAGTQVDR